MILREHLSQVAFNEDVTEQIGNAVPPLMARGYIEQTLRAA